MKTAVFPSSALGACHPLRGCSFHFGTSYLCHAASADVCQASWSPSVLQARNWQLGKQQGWPRGTGRVCALNLNLCLVCLCGITPSVCSELGVPSAGTEGVLCAIELPCLFARWILHLDTFKQSLAYVSVMPVKKPGVLGVQCELQYQVVGRCKEGGLLA